MNSGFSQYKGFSQYPEQQSNFNQIREQNGKPMEWNSGSYNQQYAINKSQNIGQIQQQVQNYKKVEGIYYFKPSATFRGSMPGWYFGTGKHGTGYYMDMRQL